MCCHRGKGATQAEGRTQRIDAAVGFDARGCVLDTRLPKSREGATVIAGLGADGHGVMGLLRKVAEMSIGKLVPMIASTETTARRDLSCATRKTGGCCATYARPNVPLV